MLRYADEGHLARDWSEMTRDIKSISTAAPRAATYVNKLKVTAMCIFLLYSMPFIFFCYLAKIKSAKICPVQTCSVFNC